MEVASKLVAFRIELLDATIQIPNEFTLGGDVDNMHLYHPSLQGCIADAVTADPLVPTIPIAKSKLATKLVSPPPRIYAKLFPLPLRKNTDNVLVVADAKNYVVYS